MIEAESHLQLFLQTYSEGSVIQDLWQIWCVFVHIIIFVSDKLEENNPLHTHLRNSN